MAAQEAERIAAEIAVEDERIAAARRERAYEREMDRIERQAERNRQRQEQWDRDYRRSLQQSLCDLNPNRNCITTFSY